MQMTTIRVFFAKTGRARYISHLDTMRTLTRALRRSRLPLWYTEGFNPHLYLTFALPISLGYESEGESLDIRLVEEVEEEELLRRLRACFPPGFSVLRAAVPVMEPKEIAWADYAVELEYSSGNAAPMEAAFRELLEQPVIEVLKKTKKGEKTVDIRPMSRLLESRADGNTLKLSLRMAAGITLNINPTLLLSEFFRRSGETPERVGVRRTAILTGEFAVFA